MAGGETFDILSGKLKTLEDMLAKKEDEISNL
jgi:hypothetical protein